MANKRATRRRRMTFGSRTGQLAKIPIQVSQAVGAAIDGAVVKATLNNFSDEVVILSAKLTWSLFGHTPNEGPLQVGIATDDLSVAEIGEALDASPSSRSDQVAFEQAGRMVRLAGVFDGQVADEKLNEGRLLKTKLGFAVANNNDAVFFVRNLSGATLTTGSSVRVNGHLIVKWQ